MEIFLSDYIYLFFSVSEWKLLGHVWIFVTHNCSPPSSSIHGISQASILEWVAIIFCRGSSRRRDRTQLSCTAGEFFTIYVTRKANLLLYKHYSKIQFGSVAQSHLALWDSMDCSTSGFRVHHQLPKFAQTHVHRVGDVIQPSRPL